MAISIVAMVAVLVWLGFLFFSERYYAYETGSAHGEAAWARLRDLKRDGFFGKQGILLGRIDGKLLRLRTDKQPLRSLTGSGIF